MRYHKGNITNMHNNGNLSRTDFSYYNVPVAYAIIQTQKERVWKGIP